MVASSHWHFWWRVWRGLGSMYTALISSNVRSVVSRYCWAVYLAWWVLLLHVHASYQTQPRFGLALKVLTHRPSHNKAHKGQQRTTSWKLAVVQVTFCSGLSFAAGNMHWFCRVGSKCLWAHGQPSGWPPVYLTLGKHRACTTRVSWASPSPWHLSWPFCCFQVPLIQ